MRPRKPFKKKAVKPESLTSGSPWRTAWRRFCGSRVSLAALIVLALICLCCALAPLVARWDPLAINTVARYASPSIAHPFGCDYLGRDLLSRVLYGGRTTLRIAFCATALAALSGSALGVLAGFCGGRTDLLLMRLAEVLSAVPSLLLVILIEGLMGWGGGNFLYAIAIAAAPSFLRLMRASVMNVMGREYIEAARALGVSPAGIIRWHVIHNVAAPMLIHLTGVLSESILTCTLMSYIGVGVTQPAPEWGNLVYDGYAAMRQYPHTALFPAAVIILCVLAVNLAGSGLRDALDSREAGNHA